ncbi:MAG: NAD-dependent epimerase/dehydratase family protein [bacterium]
MKVLFIGGTGIISSACSQLALNSGIDLYLLNRGKSFRELPKGAKVLIGDIRDKNSVKEVLNDHRFDVVVNWIAFDTNHIKTDLEIFSGITKQYIFISSASAYHTPPLSLPVTESTALFNPYWEYSRNKIASEDMLTHAHRTSGFPATIVRPSHTYDKTCLPMHGGYTIVNRMRQGKKVVVHGDGTSLWVLTHNRDFAKAFIGLLGNIHSIGETYHITSDEVLTWNQIFETVADAAGTKADIVHIPSDVIAQYDKDWGDSLLGDKTHSMIFDNTKIKRAVPGFTATIPFSSGTKEIIQWYDANPAHQKINSGLDAMIDKMITNFKKLW